MEAIQLIRHDHEHIERLFKRIEQALSHEDVRAATAILREITRELSVHAAIEEQFLYPALRAARPEGDVLFAIEEHHAVKVTLSEVQATAPADPRFATKVRLMIRNVREHIEQEEHALLPALEQALEPDQLRDLGTALANAKLLSPTRPHPTAPELPPANLLAGPIVGVRDRMMDAIRDAALGVRSGAQGMFKNLAFLLRRVSADAERRGREAVDDLAVRTRVVAAEARDLGRRTVNDAQGRSVEAARQLRAPARRVAQKTRAMARSARKASGRSRRRAA